MSLTEKEKKELEILDNPNVEFLSPSYGPIIATFLYSKNKRKERVIELRTKKRMEELGLHPKKDWQKYYKIRKEEEERFDKKFNISK